MDMLVGTLKEIRDSLTDIQDIYYAFMLYMETFTFFLIRIYPTQATV